MFSFINETVTFSLKLKCSTSWNLNYQEHFIILNNSKYGIQIRKSFKWSVFQRFMLGNIRGPSTLKHTIKLGFVLNFTTDIFLCNSQDVSENLKYYLILLVSQQLAAVTLPVKICIFTTKSRAEHHVAVLPSFTNRQNFDTLLSDKIPILWILYGCYQLIFFSKSCLLHVNLFKSLKSDWFVSVYNPSLAASP